MKRLAVVLISLLGSFAPRPVFAEELVRRHTLPGGAASPDVVVREATAHLVYGKDRDAFYQRSDDGGQTFGAPIRVNVPPGSVYAAMERGPRLAVSVDGTVHVVWSPDRLLGVNYARRPAGADTFEPTRDLRYEGATAAEGATVAAHGDEVLVLWLDGKSGEPRNSPVGLPLFARRSKDGGRTFEAAGPLVHDYDGGACACCHLAASVDSDGRFLVAFRGAREGVRDVFMLRGDREGRRFRVARVTTYGRVAVPRLPHGRSPHRARQGRPAHRAHGRWPDRLQPLQRRAPSTARAPRRTSREVPARPPAR